MYLKTYTGMLPTYKYHSNFIRFIKLCFSNSDTKNNTSEQPKKLLTSSGKKILNTLKQCSEMLEEKVFKEYDYNMPRCIILKHVIHLLH